MRPKEYAKASSTIAYLPGFSAPRGRRCLSRSVRLRRLEKKLRGRRIDEYRRVEDRSALYWICVSVFGAGPRVLRMERRSRNEQMAVSPACVCVRRSRPNCEQGVLKRRRPGGRHSGFAADIGH